MSNYATNGLPSSNPIKTFRDAEALSIDDLAFIADVSRTAIVRTEQGVYDEVPPNIMAVVQSRGYSFTATRDSYKSFISAQRRNSFGSLTPELPEWELRLTKDKTFYYIAAQEPPVEVFSLLNTRDELVSVWHPFTHWRLCSAIPKQLTVCRLFCIHPSRMSEFELHNKFVGVPNSIVDALRESGYSEHTLKVLNDRYNMYRKALITNSILTPSEGMAYERRLGIPA